MKQSRQDQGENLKILELEIHNIRGIPHLLIKPEGKNLLVWGPNGSGKSSLVDAVDFLLTGQISRLKGGGTGGITLKKHGPHIDHQPDEASVRAVIKLPKSGDTIEIRRSMSLPATLEYDKSKEILLEPIITLASRGQHVLTRRDILRYVTADAGTRAREIQRLLNIAEIEEIRKALVRVDNEFSKNLDSEKNSLDRSRGSIATTIEKTTFEKDEILHVVNKKRSILGGHPISTLCSKDLKRGLVPPTVSSHKCVGMESCKRSIQYLLKLDETDEQSRIEEIDKKLRESVNIIRSTPHMLRAISLLELTAIGIKLVDETGNCPLCDASWPPGKLNFFLKERLSIAQTAVKLQEQIVGLSSSIGEVVNRSIASVSEVIDATKYMNFTDDVLQLQCWERDLKELSDALSAAMEKYPSPRFGSNQVKRVLAPQDMARILTHIERKIKPMMPETTPEQEAWDTLTRLEENLKNLESAEDQLEEARQLRKKSKILLDGFLNGRDRILEELYDNIRDRFVALYRNLHEPDEDAFSANIRPKEAGIEFEVDFYGRGTHPPQALHSEGHQDSMGLCLYLCLAEYLIEGVIDLIILDDVVMSIDTNHRRQICNILATSFPDRQFLITTHDRTWANQLRSEGVVTSENSIEFCNWDINGGPQIGNEIDLWDRIEEDLQKNDIPSAAGRLRRGSEGFFGIVCHAIKAQTTHKLDGRYDLGDLLPAAMKQYLSLLRKAKEAAQSWGDKNNMNMLKELHSVSSQIFGRSGVEQWAVDANIHYNNWTNFTKEDFRPVVEAFHDLHELFVCRKCGSTLHLVTKGRYSEEAFRCNCGEVNWNLVKKKLGS